MSGSAAMLDAADTRLVGLDALSTSVILLDESDHIVYLNAAAEHLFGTARRIAIGEPLARIFEPDPMLHPMIVQARAPTQGDTRTDIAVRTLVGETIDLLVTVSAPEAFAGLIMIECQQTDVRARAAREERVRALAEENSDLLRNLAHEVKNPLGGIRGAAQLIALEVETASQRECAEVIVREADRLQALVDRLLAPHRQVLTLEMVNLHEVCERVRTLVLSEFSSGLEIMRDYDISLPDIRGDKAQLIQAVLNLVRNAAQALAGKGRIDLVTRVARQVTIIPKRHKLALELHVIDNGPGIPATMQDRIFLPLVTGRDDGTGLGLTLAQSIIARHGGLIDVQSEPGRTDFRILLPLSEGTDA
ncbi:MAG: nitrogen regulation protein NR(II) [Burkholderiaceae bacterium]